MYLCHSFLLSPLFLLPLFPSLPSLPPSLLSPPLPPSPPLPIPTKAHASGVSLTLCSSISRSHAQTHHSHALSIRPSRSSLGHYYYTTDGPARRPAWSAVSGTRLRLTAVSCVDLGSSPCQDCQRRHIGYYPVR